MFAPKEIWRFETQSIKVQQSDLIIWNLEGQSEIEIQILLSIDKHCYYQPDQRAKACRWNNKRVDQIHEAFRRESRDDGIFHRDRYLTKPEEPGFINRKVSNRLFADVAKIISIADINTLAKFSRWRRQASPSVSSQIVELHSPRELWNLRFDFWEGKWFVATERIHGVSFAEISSIRICKQI